MSPLPSAFPLPSLKNFLRCASLLGGVALPLAILAPLPLGAAGEAPAKTEIPAKAPAKRPPSVRSTLSLLQRKDYAALETLVASIKAKGYQIEQTDPDLGTFYGAIQCANSDSEQKFLQRGQEIEEWLAAVPESSAARIALGNWWTEYAWKARGYGWASTVTKEGWKLLKERLDKAAEVLVALPPEKVDDPHYFCVWLTIAMGQGWSLSQMNRYFEGGVAIAKEYSPLYWYKGEILLPKWQGDEDDLEDFATEAANHLPGEKGDLLYARLIMRKAGSAGEDFFKESKADYARAKRGFEHGMRSRDHLASWRARSSLCKLAAIKGDAETASRLFLELGPIRENGYFYGTEFQELRERCGAQARIDAVRALEKAGKLEEAEKQYATFTPDPLANDWLKAFYMRHGMKEKFLAMKDIPKLKLDPATAPLNEAFDLAVYGVLWGDWEGASTAAERFDAKRPWNITGRTVLLLRALHDHDSARAQSLLTALLQYKSNRPAYQTAQAVLSGQKRWKDVANELKPDFGYNEQAAVAIAAGFVAQGKPALARNVAETMLARGDERSSFMALFESLLHGPLAPMFAGE